MQKLALPALTWPKIQQPIMLCQAGSQGFRITIHHGPTVMEDQGHRRQGGVIRRTCHCQEPDSDADAGQWDHVGVGRQWHPIFAPTPSIHPSGESFCNRSSTNGFKQQPARRLSPAPSGATEAQSDASDRALIVKSCARPAGVQQLPNRAVTTNKTDLEHSGRRDPGSAS